MTLDQPLAAHFAGAKFLFIIGQYSNLGGAERQAIILANSFQTELDCSVEFIAWGGKGRVSELLDELRIPYHRFQLIWNTTPAGKIKSLWKLVRYIRSEIKPDYLLPYIGFNSKIAGLVWRLAGAKYTWWNQRDEGRDIHGSRLEKRLVWTLPDVVSNSTEGKDFLIRKFGVSPDRVRIINNGIQIPGNSCRTFWRNKLGIGEAEILISMVASLSRYKDHKTLLRAFAKVIKSPSAEKCHLILAGDYGETTNELKALSFDLHLCKRVSFIGPVDNVNDVYAASDIVVHSSFNEGCPNAVLEAMANERCVIGTNISGVRQALGDEVSQESVAAAQDSDELAARILHFVENAEERMRMGRLNRLRVKKHYSVKSLTENVLIGIAENAKP